MPRYKLTIEYDGTGFLGWQSQPASITVQGALEAAIEVLHGQHITLHGAGRTDTGVHALAQIAHFDSPKVWDPFVLCNAINGNVRPHAVSVVAAEQVPDDFEARFSAIKRRYLYRILNRRAPPTLDKHNVWHVPMDLNVDAMHEGAQHLIGKHDFTTFRAAECQSPSPVKTLERLDVMRFDEMVEIRAEARSFLHHQVRSIVGSLVRVGQGKWHPLEIKRALEAKDRSRCGPVCPPDGLYLVEVLY
ncbi:tRNA pseudouridine(38-40) synthase TruA [Aestuariivirga litoralis]|uniref:tRNA pseudouridine(38-40) synthase TruA n=1 Tax=Aestuariivirga litoralis TaxID=2650924 RepID=UPI0018C4CD64|nr:tRNA pseudouridine(38-40) synthase TruA [Aestuariivirga litoralis]MBG1232765.1 tRNA pseudouridine(38-40) synthase TruA [Aestuariivirga litoralis]